MCQKEQFRSSTDDKISLLLDSVYHVCGPAPLLCCRPIRVRVMSLSLYIYIIILLQYKRGKSRVSPFQYGIGYVLFSQLPAASILGPAPIAAATVSGKLTLPSYTFPLHPGSPPRRVAALHLRSQVRALGRAIQDQAEPPPPTAGGLLLVATVAHVHMPPAPPLPALAPTWPATPPAAGSSTRCLELMPPRRAPPCVVPVHGASFPGAGALRGTGFLDSVGKPAAARACSLDPR